MNPDENETEENEGEDNELEEYYEEEEEEEVNCCSWFYFIANKHLTIEVTKLLFGAGSALIL